jgi:4-hydroxybenzoate polyprenyltransferase
MNVVTAAVLATGGLGVDWLSVFLVGVAISLLYCGGMSLNDFCDRHWDAEHQPYRPIPAGKVNASTVGWMALLLLAAGIGLLLFAPSISGFFAGLGLLTTIVAYDYFHKAHAATVLLMASARLWVFVVTALALKPELQPIVLFAGSLQFVYTLLVTVVARHENTRGKPYGFPLIPRMIAGMALLDGLVLAFFVDLPWLALGAAMAFLTRLGQRFVRGD